jgi:hypothetical protein
MMVAVRRSRGVTIVLTLGKAMIAFRIFGTFIEVQKL